MGCHTDRHADASSAPEGLSSAFNCWQRESYKDVHVGRPVIMYHVTSEKKETGIRSGRAPLDAHTGFNKCGRRWLDANWRKETTSDVTVTSFFGRKFCSRKSTQCQGHYPPEAPFLTGGGIFTHSGAHSADGTADSLVPSLGKRGGRWDWRGRPHDRSPAADTVGSWAHPNSPTSTSARADGRDVALLA